MPERCRYLYGVSRGLDLGAPEGVVGLSGGMVEGVVVAGLTGLVSSVDLDEYGEEGLWRNLERLDWLEAASKGHDAVVQAASALAPTATMPFATIYLDDDGVRERITNQYDAISAVLDRVEGHEEWSVKVLTRSSASTAAAGSPLMEASERLSQHWAEREASRKDVLDAHVLAERVHDALVACAVLSRRLPPDDPSLTGHTGSMVHNVAYLVPTTRSTEFAAVIGEQAARNREVVIDARGPWPPYSFARLDEAPP